MAGHVSVARRARAHVKVRRSRRGYSRIAGSSCRTAAQSEGPAPGFRVVSIQEAGLDGFWIHRILEREGIESYVVDPASIATSRRRRRAKTDKIDGEALVRALLTYKRGEPRVCAMLRVSTPEEEDRRRLVRERKTLTNERVRHVNRVKGLLFGQGICGYQPLNRDRRKRLEELVTGDGRPLPPALKAQISREFDRIELLIEQRGSASDRIRWSIGGAKNHMRA
jgi:transposase